MEGEWIYIIEVTSPETAPDRHQTELQPSSRPHISLSLTNPYSSKTNAKGELALLVTEIETG